MSKLRLATILLVLLFISCPLITQAAPTPLELPGIVVQQSATVKFGSGIGEAVVFKARNESSRTKPWVQGIARWDEAAKGWPVLHLSHYYFDAVVAYQVVELLPGGVQQVILTQRSGSGGFLSYDVFGAADGKLQTLLSRSQIFLGRVRVRDNMLIEDNGDLQPHGFGMVTGLCPEPMKNQPLHCVKAIKLSATGSMCQARPGWKRRASA